jgi:hypothetical protein
MWPSRLSMGPLAKPAVAVPRTGPHRVPHGPAPGPLRAARCAADRHQLHGADLHGQRAGHPLPRPAGGEEAPAAQTSAGRSHRPPHVPPPPTAHVQLVSGNPPWLSMSCLRRAHRLAHLARSLCRRAAAAHELLHQHPRRRAAQPRAQDEAVHHRQDHAGEPASIPRDATSRPLTPPRRTLRGNPSPRPPPHLSSCPSLGRCAASRLSARTRALSRLQGVITSWAAPDIAADNPGITLPDRPITIFYRQLSSGTTAVITQYLVIACPASACRAEGRVAWPQPHACRRPAHGHMLYPACVQGRARCRAQPNPWPA